MTVKEFLKRFNGSPYDYTELAECATKVKGKLGKIANNFLYSQREFEKELENIGFEWG